MKLLSGAFIVPHPEKSNRRRWPGDVGGEDAYFISGFLAVGVADGVGGWATRGIDAGIYARQLMMNAQKYIENNDEEITVVDALAFSQEVVNLVRYVVSALPLE